MEASNIDIENLMHVKMTEISKDYHQNLGDAICCNIIRGSFRGLWRGDQKCSSLSYSK